MWRWRTTWQNLSQANPWNNFVWILNYLFFKVLDVLIVISFVMYNNCSRGGRYREEEAKTIVVQILSAVAYFHLQGVVHRDLKPEVRHSGCDCYQGITSCCIWGWTIFWLPPFCFSFLDRIFFLPPRRRMLLWRSLTLVCLILLGQVVSAVRMTAVCISCSHNQHICLLIFLFPLPCVFLICLSSISWMPSRCIRL